VNTNSSSRLNTDALVEMSNPNNKGGAMTSPLLLLLFSTSDRSPALPPVMIWLTVSDDMVNFNKSCVIQNVRTTANIHPASGCRRRLCSLRSLSEARCTTAAELSKQIIEHGSTLDHRVHAAYKPEQTVEIDL
jgi:hypothetical protein